MNSTLRTFSLARRSFINYLTARPLCVSFEITHSCNARCKHCHRGGHVDEQQASPQKFAKVFNELKPVVIQISGGEPLLRKDVEEVITALKQPDGTPYIVFVTNAALLTKEKYYRLREIGVDAFSVSLDYPDERHDEFRNIPGLFQKIRNLVENVDGSRKNVINLNSVVQRHNYHEMMAMAHLARDWGVSINFSPYTWLRTQDKDYMIPKEELPEFMDIVKQLITFKKQHDTVRTTDSFFYDMAYFFEHESIPNCRAGERFLVVNPDGTLSPCGLIITDYHSWSELKENFTRNNTCTSCHTCIRASTEKPFNNLINGALRTITAR